MSFLYFLMLFSTFLYKVGSKWLNFCDVAIVEAVIGRLATSTLFHPHNVKSVEGPPRSHKDYTPE